MKLIYKNLLIPLCYVFATMGLILMFTFVWPLTWLYKRSEWPSGLTAMNCWAFCVAKWLEADARNTYLIIKMSKHMKLVPHVLYAKSINGLSVEELIPMNKPRPGWRRFFHAFWHKGRVRKGNGEEACENNERSKR